MAKPPPTVTAMMINYVADVGYSVHVHTDAGEMDVTLTETQYLSIRAQLADTGRAIIPTFSAVAA